MSDNSYQSLNEFPAIEAVLRDGLNAGLHYGAQIYLSINGHVKLNAAWGESIPGTPLSVNQPMLWLSSGKPLTSSLFTRLWERGHVQLDQPIADVLPEFAASGKENVTFRHLLTHTAGLRQVATGWPEAGWQQVIASICASPLEPDWKLGQTAGYHPQTTWFLLGEALSKVIDTDYWTAIDREVLSPLSLDTVANGPSGITPDDDACIAPLYMRERGALNDTGFTRGIRLKVLSPGSSFRGPASMLGRFYESLLSAIRGNSTWLSAPAAVSLASRQRVNCYDLTLQHVVDFGLGVILDSKQYGVDTVPYGFGRYSSPRTFGHGGAQSSIGFCDPEIGLVAAWVTNGMAGEGYHQRRSRAINEAIYQDLGLTTEPTA